MSEQLKNQDIDQQQNIQQPITTTKDKLYQQSTVEAKFYETYTHPDYPTTIACYSGNLPAVPERTPVHHLNGIPHEPVLIAQLYDSEKDVTWAAYRYPTLESELKRWSVLLTGQ